MLYRTNQAKRVQNNARVTQQWLDEARRMGGRLPVVGNAQPRFRWDARVTLQTMDDGQVQESHYATTRDISAADVALRCRRAIAAGTGVRVTLDETGESALGTVQACAEEIGAFVVTVAFTRPSSCARLPLPRPCVGGGSERTRA